MALSNNLKNEINQFLKEKILRKIEEYNLSDEDSAKPFQYALFTKKGYLAKGFIHGCETALGNWHESIAKIIAKEKKPSETDVPSGKYKGKNAEELGELKKQLLSKIEDLEKKYESGDLLDEEYEDTRNSYQDNLKEIEKMLEKMG